MLGVHAGASGPRVIAVLDLVDEALVLFWVHPVREGSQFLTVCYEIHLGISSGRKKVANHGLCSSIVSKESLKELCEAGNTSERLIELCSMSCFSRQNLQIKICQTFKKPDCVGALGAGSVSVLRKKSKGLPA